MQKFLKFFFQLLRFENYMIIYQRKKDKINDTYQMGIYDANITFLNRCVLPAIDECMDYIDENNGEIMCPKCTKDFKKTIHNALKQQISKN